ncbi:MAG: hypothetical protein U1E60_00010 [Reyranellaceae bacterium]
MRLHQHAPDCRADRGCGGHQGLLGRDELADPVVAHGPSEHPGPGRVGDGKAELQGDDQRMGRRERVREREADARSHLHHTR